MTPRPARERAAWKRALSIVLGSAAFFMLAAVGQERRSFFASSPAPLAAPQAEEVRAAVAGFLSAYQNAMQEGGSTLPPTCPVEGPFRARVEGELGWAAARAPRPSGFLESLVLRGVERAGLDRAEVRAQETWVWAGPRGPAQSLRYEIRYALRRTGGRWALEGAEWVDLR